MQVPFEYRDGDAFLRGALRLKTPKPPLALAVSDRSSEPAVITAARVAALDGYAELTWVPQQRTAPRETPAPPRQQQPRHSEPARPPSS